MGHRFDLIPSDAVGVLSGLNRAPEAQRYSTSTSWTASVLVQDGSHLMVTQDAAHPHTTPVYLGAIVSNDRSVVYWVNNSQPLP